MTYPVIDDPRSVGHGRYTIMRELGRGGMAKVFLAHDAHDNRQVAVKILRPEVCRLLGSGRFEREISIAAALDHPQIVPLLDSGSAEGTLYYVMPLVEGQSLAERLLRENPLPVDEAVGIACDVASALTYAHERGVVHRDVKPANILLSGGRAQLADFGIARALAAVDAEQLTDSGLVPGTPIYMSPEQASGDVVDGRSDLYSLSCVLYEMLTGAPPFQGSTVNAVLAQHALAPPPSVEVIRPSVGPSVAAAVRKALAKTPADRFTTGSAFSAALRSATPVAVPAFRTTTPMALPRRRRVAMLVGRATLVAAAATAWFFMPSSLPDLDGNRVVVFPLATTDTALSRAGTGWDVALAIGAALEHTAPLRWLDGWTYLSETLRADPHLVLPEVAQRVSRERGARYYVDGVIRFADYAPTIALRLYDVGGDSLIAQETVAGPRGATLATLGMDAVTRLLPRLLASDQQVDLTPLRERNPGAIALSIQGDRAYRRSRFTEALGFYRRAVEEDSLFAFAAVKAAQAAIWENQYDDAEGFIAHASANAERLPPRYRPFVKGWRHFLAGAADSAIAELQHAERAITGWAEASMALGEVYYHLLPSTPSFDSLAHASFERALEADSLFVPAMFHLSELAIRGDRLQEADRLVARLTEADPDPEWSGHVSAMLECAHARPGRYDWTRIAEMDPDVALMAARAHTAGGAQLPCAEPGFRAVLRADSASAGTRWGALLGLQGVLLATGRFDEAVALLDSAKAAGSRGVYSLFVLDHIAGAPLQAQAAGAERLAREGTGDDYARAQPATRLLLGVWSATQGDTGRAAAVLNALRADPNAPGWVGEALAAHLDVARGDTVAAIRRLGPLLDHTPARRLTWEVTTPLAPERILLAELLLIQGDYAGADRVASFFEHQEPVVFLPFLPRSLAVRARAAEVRGLTKTAARHRERLAHLGWRDVALDKLFASIPSLRVDLPSP